MSDGFQPLDPPRFNYVDAAYKSSEELALDNVRFYITMLEGRISKAMVALDQGLPAYEVAKILQG